MQGQRTEGTPPAASPVACDAGTHHFRRWDSLPVARVRQPGEGEGVEIVHFFCGQRLGRAGQHHGAVAHRLKGPGVKAVYLPLQFLRQFEQLERVGQNFIVRGQGNPRFTLKGRR